MIVPGIIANTPGFGGPTVMRVNGQYGFGGTTIKILPPNGLVKNAWVDKVGSITPTRITATTTTRNLIL